MAQVAEQKRETGLGVAGADDFASLLQKEFKPINETRQRNIERSVQTLAQQALALTGTLVIGDDVFAMPN